MKIAHIADTHLGLAAFSRLDPGTGMNLREKQVYDNFLAAIREIVRQKPDVVVHAGDLCADECFFICHKNKVVYFFMKRRCIGGFILIIKNSV